jgi:hypothetical protein
MLLDNELATNANRAAAFGGAVVGVLAAPQPTRSTGPMRIRIERAVFLRDMSVLVVEI